jgi:CRISPR-associated endonuclease/helicase Cas3
MAVTDFWAKTDDRDNPSASKPVIEHLVDVAAVACLLLSERPALRARLAQQSRIAEAELPAVCAFLAGLHDLGKFSRTFQAKAPKFWPSGILGVLPGEGIGGKNHWRCTAVLLSNAPCDLVLRKLFPSVGPDDFDQLIAAIAGHHGVPPDTDDLPDHLWTHETELSQPCIEAAAEAADLVYRTCAVVAQSAVTVTDLVRISFLINGLTTVADWVGSDPKYFEVGGGPGGDFQPGAYWEYALAQAAKAIEGKGLLPPRPAAATDYRTLDLACAASPRPMQAETAECNIGEGPQLYFIEDTTGSGKTEAAMLLAARLMEAGKGEGIYFALPTMATANAMRDRVAPVYRRFFAPSQAADPSLILAHGKAALSRRLAELGRPTGSFGTAGDSVGAAEFCAGWIADTRKLALFADIGVGTIDQAFLAILKKKHLTLRQFALAGRILIIDEAHSFDAYMGEELKTLLRLHAMHGGSAIVLSATLPKTVRAGLCEAFRDGLAVPETRQAPVRTAGPGRAKARPASAAKPDVTLSDKYPLLTRANREGIADTEVAFDRSLARTVEIGRLDCRADAMTQAVGAAARGACVAVICNAVDEAIDMYRGLCAAHEPGKVDLFHARFAMGDRMEIERRVIERFGKASTPDRRRGQILVATQVIEQSLDLDFDLVITDLAPIDLLIQRAGRLWRHMAERPRAARPLDAPRLLVVSPDPAIVTDARWLEPALGKAAFVYRHAGVMWRSAKHVFDAGALTVPDDLRGLVEAVYSEGAMPVPDCLSVESGKGDGEHYGAQSLARMNVIDPAGGYLNLSGLSANEDVGTRLGDETITIRLARRENGGLVPWYSMPGADERLCLELSEVTLRQELWNRSAGESDQQSEALRRFRRDWPDYEREMPVLVVEDALQGELSVAIYDRKFGFQMNTKADE